tara:strand:- start:2275 stop:2763 length:489 start_codon:yes stop_codon:yes gene_type:complete
MQVTPFIAGKRAIAVYPSNNTDIPFPAVVTSGTNDAVSKNQLEDTTVDFIVLGVSVGDIVYNTTTSTSAQVTSIFSPQSLVLNDDIFQAQPETYVIYTSNEVSGNEGCIVYVGDTAVNTVKVTTISGDVVTFSNIQLGGYVPCVVTRVWNTGTSATQLIAIW